MDQVKSEGRYRVFAQLSRDAKAFPKATYHLPSGKTKDVLVFCSNDYTASSASPKVIDALCAAAKEHGVGSGGTRNISGTSSLHVKLETSLADMHGTEAALVFSSCYVANETTLSTMSKHLPNATMLSDALNHASMIQVSMGFGILSLLSLIYRWSFWGTSVIPCSCLVGKSLVLYVLWI